MHDIVIYNCTFLRDLERSQRMIESVAKHNKDNIPVYISVPRKDLEAFRKGVPDWVTVINEEDIIACNPLHDLNRLYQQINTIQQQIIKSEFWRLGLCENFLVVDSDCYFIRDFYKSDFIVESNVPYSVIHEGRSITHFANHFGPYRYAEEFVKDREHIRDAFGRKGILYDFGYAPFLWSRQVWIDLEKNFLIPQNMSFMDAIIKYPSEFTVYGEALLKYKSIPLHPREELFRHYHYENQYWFDRALGFDEKLLAKSYLGVVSQSNWEHWLSHGKSNKGFFSKVNRFIKRLRKRIEFFVKFHF